MRAGMWDGNETRYDQRVRSQSGGLENLRRTLYVTANHITNSDKKRTVLLSVCGPKTYHTIRDLEQTDRPRIRWDRYESAGALQSNTGGDNVVSQAKPTSTKIRVNKILKGKQAYKHSKTEMTNSLSLKPFLYTFLIAKYCSVFHSGGDKLLTTQF